MQKFDYLTFKLELEKEGLKVCPCCLSGQLEFTTDDRHQEYWLTCAFCKVGIRHHLFSTLRKNWNRRNSDDPKMHKITHDIEYSWFDGNKTEYFRKEE